MPLYVISGFLPSHQLPITDSANTKVNRVIAEARKLYYNQQKEIREIKEGNLASVFDEVQKKIYNEHLLLHGGDKDKAAEDSKNQAYTMLYSESASGKFTLIGLYCCSSNGKNMDPNVGTSNKAAIFVEGDSGITAEVFLNLCGKVLVERDGLPKPGLKVPDSYAKYNSYKLPFFDKPAYGAYEYRQTNLEYVPDHGYVRSSPSYSSSSRSSSSSESKNELLEDPYQPGLKKNPHQPDPRTFFSGSGPRIGDDRSSSRSTVSTTMPEELFRSLQLKQHGFSRSFSTSGTTETETETQSKLKTLEAQKAEQEQRLLKALAEAEAAKKEITRLQQEINTIIQSKDVGKRCNFPG